MKAPSNKRATGDSSTASIRVAIAEDHGMVRESLAESLRREGKIVVPFHAANGVEFLEKLTKHSIDIALVDLDMPEMDGKQLLEYLQRRHPEIQVIIFSQFTNIHIVAELIQLGAKSYLKKECSYDELVDAIFNVKYNGYHTSDIVGASVFVQAERKKKKEKSMLYYQFSEREMFIISMICSGGKSEEIASRLNLTKKSIDGIRARLFNALNAKTPADFARICIEKGLYQPIKMDE